MVCCFVCALGGAGVHVSIPNGVVILGLNPNKRMLSLRVVILIVFAFAI